MEATNSLQLNCEGSPIIERSMFKGNALMISEGYLGTLQDHNHERSEL